MVRIATAALACAALPASAHALLERSAPPVGSTVASAPTEIGLDFSERVEPSFCTVTVLNEAGSRVDRNDLHGAGGHLAIGVVGLPPGAYKVIWHAVSADTHRTEGSFAFTIAP